jgi:hypothetical protein
MLTKDHQYGFPIKDIKFHASGNVVSSDTKIIKIWNKNNVSDINHIFFHLLKIIIKLKKIIIKKREITLLQLNQRMTLMMFVLLEILVLF